MTDKDTESDRRFSGILTPSDREILSGKEALADHPDRNKQRQARYRIRERVKNSLRDFETLNRQLTERDRAKILADLSEENLDPITSVLAFCYLGSHDLAEETMNVDIGDVNADHIFEKLVKRGIETGEEYFDNPTESINVEIEIDSGKTAFDPRQDSSLPNSKESQHQISRPHPFGRYPRKSGGKTERQNTQEKSCMGSKAEIPCHLQGSFSLPWRRISQSTDPRDLDYAG